MLQRSIAPSLAFVCLIAPLRAQDVTLELLADGLVEPLWAASPGADPNRLFIAEQRPPRIRVFDQGQLLPEPFLDLTSVASVGIERGLLGVALHPGYSSNGRFFVSYTALNGDGVVAEYRASSDDENRADSAAVQVLLTVPQPAAIHNVNGMEFGPDGMLYIACGDGGGVESAAQQGDLLRGKLLRLDVDAPAPFIPIDNPFVGDPEIRDEIWAFGLRNPWRIAFDAVSGSLWIADVGLHAFEEINVQLQSSSGGQNYGWPCMEGSQCSGLGGCDCESTALTPPAFEYSHASGCSIIGGIVYRGQAIPDFQGRYFFADWCARRVWSVRLGLDGIHDLQEHTLEFDPPGPQSLGMLHSFGQDANGELLLVDGQFGRLYRAVPTCGTRSYCLATTNSTGVGARLSASGSTSLAANDLSLLVQSAVPLETGIFFYGGVPQRLPMGDGYLCINGSGADIFRLAPVQIADRLGNVQLDLDYDAPPLAYGAGRVLPGRTWHFQHWYRDPQGPGGSGFNFTDALSVTFCP